MTGFDYAVFGIIAVSIGLGWWRGFVYELLSLLGWIAAGLIARTYAPDVVQFVPDLVSAEVAKMAVAYAGLFMLSMIVSGVLAWAISKLVKIVGLGLMDGVMGSVFGLLRGMLLVLILVLLAGLTSVPQMPVWRDAWSSPLLQKVAIFTKDFLPEVVAKKVSY